MKPALVALVLASVVLMAPEGRGEGSPPWPGQLRAVHIGGYWGTNKTETTRGLPADFFTYLRRLQVDTVGISVALFVDNVTDASVERVYKQGEPDPADPIIYTFADEDLRRLIRVFRQNGFRVYLTLALEEHLPPPELAEAQARLCRTREYPIKRWQLGDPNAPLTDPCIDPAMWAWDPANPGYGAFVAAFWNSYAAQAEYYGRIAEEEGVFLYSLGTETESLFRTRPGGVGPNDFLPQLQSMVASVRAVYHGLLTYDMLYAALTTPQYFGPGSSHLWEDLKLDVLGISAYFPLVGTPPTAVLPVTELEARWEDVFQRHLIPLQAANPGRPLVFTEFGYTDSVRAPFEPNADAFLPRVVTDTNGNGLDDGGETQANVYHALFNVMNRYPGVLDGAFLWGNMVSGEALWTGSFGVLRGHDIRGKPAEGVVKAAYEVWAGPLPLATALVASVLPSSRSVQVDSMATAFVTVINAGNAPAVGVGVSLSATVPWRLAYQTTDPQTNLLTGTPYTLADIPAGQRQTYVIALTPLAPFGPSDVAFTFVGANTAPAPVVAGLDTLWLSASTTAVPDIVAISATPTNDGIVEIPGAAGAAAFVVATANVGASAHITVTADSSAAALPVGLTMCQTDPVSSVCVLPPGPAVATRIDTGQTPTFAVFVGGHGIIPFDPSGHRIVVRFRDDDGTVRGATSVAVRTR